MEPSIRYLARMPSEGVSPCSPELLLLPTERERALFLAEWPRGLALVEACGFGPVASAARSAELLARLRPRRVCLVGIAGTFDPRSAPVGSARVFDSVVQDGIGVGRGASFRGPSALGLPQWPGSESCAAIHDTLVLARPHVPGALADPLGLLLTVPSASATEIEAAERRERFPRAIVEDMEGFAVALASALRGVPLVIVRGISNRVGDRRANEWRIPEAMAAARELARAVLSAPWEPPA